MSWDINQFNMCTHSTNRAMVITIRVPNENTKVFAIFFKSGKGSHPQNCHSAALVLIVSKVKRSLIQHANLLSMVI